MAMGSNIEKRGFPNHTSRSFLVSTMNNLGQISFFLTLKFDFSTFSLVGGIGNFYHNVY